MFGVNAYVKMMREQKAVHRREGVTSGTDNM